MVATTAVRNWVFTLAVILSAYFAGLLVLLGDEALPLARRMEYWWWRGGFCQIIAVALGYFALQLLAGGHLDVRQLRKTAAWVALVPCLLAGNCAGSAYQGARALGWIGESTEERVATAYKLSYRDGAWVRTGDGGGELEEWNEYRLIVEARCCGEWDLPSGALLTGYEIPVSEEIYRHHRVGSSVMVVELPGELYPSRRLSTNVKESTKANATGAVFWSSIAFVALLKIRKQTRITRAA